MRRSPPGARSLRLHPYDTRGRETLDAEPCAATLQAVRAACPGVQVSLSTSSAIEADSERRLALIADWTELPDLVTANQGEAGIAELCRLLRHRGVGIEAGLLSVQDARAFVAADLAAPCVRAMIQPLDPDPNAATDHADAIERVLHDAGVQLPQIHHGDGIASWAVNRRAIGRGHGIRTGLEDTPVLPDGRLATANGELVEAAAALLV
ncbi:MAG: 3-keto-5-aminohexanoate cleavage protein [Actinomycetota bacterium]|nr:3-keto-5-aminohexanoate cleavage protein [Actinomycetota bacterium]